ncbi:MAG: hypothetical protein IT372_13980, partial [Polyangiaceae bacterium]|nr:hypothetical protein [Polyangiaceae bacterium]
NDETVTIGNSRTKTVENDETVTIGNSSSLVVKNSQDIDIGQHLSKMVKLSEREVTGVSRTVTVGVNRSTQVGMIDSTTVGDTFVVRVSRPGEQLMSPSTSCLLQDRLVNLDTGEGAKIVMMGDTITIEARSIVIQGNEEVEIRSPKLTKISGGEELRIDSAAGDVIVTSGKIIKLNPDS